MAIEKSKFDATNKKNEETIRILKANLSSLTGEVKSAR